MQVYIAPDTYPWAGTVKYWPGGLSADLTGYIPATPGMAVQVLIYVRGSDNTLQYLAGTEFPVLLPPAGFFDMMPYPPAGSVPCAWMYLPNGVTEFDWDNIFDARLVIGVMGGSLTPGLHGFLDSTVHTGTATQDPTQGSIVFADATPEWNELVIGTAHQLLKVNAGGTLPAWASFDWDDIAAAAAADMGHDHSAAVEGGQLDWDVVWADAVHDHSAVGEGGQLDWDTVWTDAVHDHGSAAEGGDEIVPDRIGLATAVADQDSTIALTETADPTNAANEGRIYVKDDGSGNTELYFMDESGNVTKLTPAGTVPAPTAEGQALVSNAVPAWIADTTPLWLGAHTHADNVIFDDGVGDSPHLVFINQSNNQVDVFLEETDDVFVIQLADEAGASTFVIRDSGGHSVFIVDSDGNVSTVGLTVFGNDAYLSGSALHFDNDDNTYIEAPVDDTLDIYIGAALDFSFTPNVFNVLAGSGIVMGNNTTIGQAAGPLITFDDTLNYLEIMGCNVGIGTAIPGRKLEVASPLAMIRLKDTDEAANVYAEVSGGFGHFYFRSDPLDARVGSLILFQIDGGDVMQIDGVGQVKIASLAGVGVRNVVVDAAGNLSAP